MKRPLKILLFFLTLLAAVAGFAGEVDRLLAADWERHGLKAGTEIPDSLFIRRAYLGFAGRLPTIAEAQEFVRDKNPGKCEALIDRLLADDAFADYWAMKWCDVLRVKSEFPINLWPNAVYVYSRYIREALDKNKPFDQLASEMLLATGSNFRDPPVNFYRATARRTPEGIAEVVALTFLGKRFEHMSEAEKKNFAAFFNTLRYKSTKEWKEEIVYVLPEESPGVLTLPDGWQVKLNEGDDRRGYFVRYLLGDGKTVFACAVVNRAWYWLMGRGLTEVADDLDTPAANLELLEYLSGEFIRSGYDFKALCRLIGNSAAFRVSPFYEDDEAKARAHFAAYNVFRLDAEVIDDIIGDITTQRSSYSSVIPEPFTFIPKSNRTITLADGSMTSQFLIMFGRPARDSGLLEERGREITAKQRLYLMNSGEVFGKLHRIYNRPEFQKTGPKQRIELLYWLFFSRPPESREHEALMAAYQACKDGKQRWNFWIDTAWVLMNSGEFIYQH